jgi:cobalt-zinc-cadmium efflux system membrane fusion protein
MNGFKSKRTWIIAALAIVAVAVVADLTLIPHRSALIPHPLPVSPGADSTLELTDEQLKSVQLQPAAEKLFVGRREALGNITFNEQKSSPVFPPYAGKIIDCFTDVGSDVARGQALYTIDSPDLLQAESTLISTAGTLELTTRALTRARALIEVKGIAEKDLQQAISDHQTAEAAWKAAHDAARQFGKSEDDITQIVKTRHVDSVLTVRSPFAGRVVARNAAAGRWAAPGTDPAPISVADVSVMWMQAWVVESDVPALKPGQTVSVHVDALPGREFKGKVSNMGASLDPDSHRTSVRAEVRDPKHELMSGMLATFVISTSDQSKSPGVPLDGVVREGDGTLIAWVTQDNRHFQRRVVKVGLQQDGFYQILSGVNAGETVATEGALFLSQAWDMRAR